MNISKIFIWLIVVIAFIGFYKIIGHEIILFFFNIIGRISARILRKTKKEYVDNRKRFAKLNDREKKKNLSYKFHTLLSEILLDLGWHQNGATAEGLKMTISILSFLIAGTLYFLIKNILFTVIFGVITYTLTVTALFVTSRSEHKIRRDALMDAEDILCGFMSRGVVAAVENNIALFHPKVKPVFSKFLDNYYHRNRSVFEALEELNRDCGVRFDNFCSSAKSFEELRRPGMERIFAYNIRRNGIDRELNLRCDMKFKEMNKYFLIAIGIVCAFIIMSMGLSSHIVEIYSSSFGKLIITFYVTLLSSSYIAMQVIQNKTFK